jgi:hypothetical protein
MLPERRGGMREVVHGTSGSERVLATLAQAATARIAELGGW